MDVDAAVAGVAGGALGGLDARDLEAVAREDRGQVARAAADVEQAAGAALEDLAVGAEADDRLQPQAIEQQARAGAPAQARARHVGAVVVGVVRREVLGVQARLRDGQAARVAADDREVARARR